jgi:hypothetical protein
VVWFSYPGCIVPSFFPQLSMSQTLWQKFRSSLLVDSVCKLVKRVLTIPYEIAKLFLNTTVFVGSYPLAYSIWILGSVPTIFYNLWNRKKWNTSLFVLWEEGDLIEINKQQVAAYKHSVLESLTSLYYAATFKLLRTLLRVFVRYVASLILICLGKRRRNPSPRTFGSKPNDIENALDAIAKTQGEFIKYPQLSTEGIGSWSLMPGKTS